MELLAGFACLRWSRNSLCLSHRIAHAPSKGPYFFIAMLGTFVAMREIVRVMRPLTGGGKWVKPAPSPQSVGGLLPDVGGDGAGCHHRVVDSPQ